MDLCRYRHFYVVQLVTSDQNNLQGADPETCPEDARLLFALFVEVNKASVLYKGWPE
jgi:hypothetical protein